VYALTEFRIFDRSEVCPDVLILNIPSLARIFGLEDAYRRYAYVHTLRPRRVEND